MVVTVGQEDAEGTESWGRGIHMEGREGNPWRKRKRWRISKWKVSVKARTFELQTRLWTSRGVKCAGQCGTGAARTYHFIELSARCVACDDPVLTQYSRRFGLPWLGGWSLIGRFLVASERGAALSGRITKETSRHSRHRAGPMGRPEKGAPIDPNAHGAMRYHDSRVR